MSNQHQPRGYRTIVLSDNAYQPRPTYGGGTIRDLMPYEGATDYVISEDGSEFGILYQGGRIDWLGSSVEAAFGDDVELVED